MPGKGPAAENRAGRGNPDARPMLTPRAFASSTVLRHGVGIPGMEAAGDVDRGGEIDHGSVIAHFPCAKSFAEIAVEIDCHDVVSACREWILG